MDYNPPSSTLWTGQQPDKSCQVLIREYPHRALAIASSTHALILRHSSTTSEGIANGTLASVASARPHAGSVEAGASKCMVEFSPESDHILSDYRPLLPLPVYGTLGLISIGREVFLCVITQASRLATLRPGETVEKIECVRFFCLNSADYDDDAFANPYDDAYDHDSEAGSTYGQSVAQRGPREHPCQKLQELLGNGTFYYSTDFDVTNRMQDRSADAVTFDIDNFDEAFLWNSYMISPLVEFRSRMQQQERDALDHSRILTSAIRGFCKTMAIPQSSAPLKVAAAGLPSYLTVISRLSCKRAGTRFNARGIDDDGNVANFVETETIYWSPSGVVFSYAQVRGSVPIFWEQASGLLPNQQKITVTRSADGTQPAFNKHFLDLERAYGAVHVVNLLSATKSGEAELTASYRTGIQHCPLSHPGHGRSDDHALLKCTEYDFHAETKGPLGYEAASGIKREILDSAEAFDYYLAHERNETKETANGLAYGGSRRYAVALEQGGVFRTNCLDCLDRTNLIQTIISHMTVAAFLKQKGHTAAPDFWSRHASLWADNGDSLSKTYAGTGALKSSFTRSGKMSLAGAVADIRKSATRLYINNFHDKARQETIDTLLGRLVGQVPVILYDPISDFVNFELQRRKQEFSSTQKITIFIGTFNLNGRTEGIDEDLSSWLCPPELGARQPEIVAVGFQEIVELNPQQMMNSDPSRKQLWEKAIKKKLDKHAEKVGGEQYVLLRSGQLVGAAMCIFVRASALHNIRNVEGNVKKTGLSGMAGNKGAVAIRLDYASTPICFVTAHLAAGFANYEERNRDYSTINHGLRFPRNRGIDDHDSVIWFGDFNYRIGLGLEAAKELLRRRDLGRLYANDQLNLQMVAGLAFRFYNEAPISFMPTYKYDVGTDNFDSSEKARIPAWTDRILRKGTNLRQLSYNSAPLRFSDHRPVYALFECTVSIVHEALRAAISREVYNRRKREVGNGTANLAGDDSEDEDLIGYDAIEPGLPPASSSHRKWWLENGKHARSSVSPPKPSSNSSGHQLILNPKRPSNPYAPTDEPDWVKVPRSESRLSSFSSISSSPFEHINHTMLLSTSASTSAPRKIPAPYDASSLPAKFGRLAMDDGKSTQADGPPPPPPRRQNTLGGTPSANISLLPARIHEAAPSPSQMKMPLSPERPAKAKSPPPVAKKPAHLTKSPSWSSSPCTTAPAGKERSRHLEPRTHGKPDLSPRSTATSQISLSGLNGRSMPQKMHPAVQSREMGAQRGLITAGRTGHAGAVGLPGMTDAPSPLPSCKPVAGQQPQAPVTQRQSQPAFDLLGDDAGVDMVGMAALKPSR